MHRLPTALQTLLAGALFLSGGCSPGDPISGLDPVVAAQLTAGDAVALAVILDPQEFQRWPLDPFTLLRHTFSGDTLTLSVQYGGGCREHRFALLVGDTFMESHPVQVAAALAHNADGDLCRALLGRDLSYDLSPLRALYQAAYGPDPGEVILGLGDRRISFTF